MGVALFLVVLGALGAMPVWFIPAIALGLAWWVVSPNGGGLELFLVGGAIALAGPLSVGLAGSILNRVCVVGRIDYAAATPQIFRSFGLVLIGALVFSSNAPLELIVTVGELAARGTSLDLLGIVTRIGSAVCVCGGLLALVGLGAIVLIEVPLRWCSVAYRISPLDITLSALRPLVIVGVAAAMFQLGGALVLHETAPRILGGLP